MVVGMALLGSQGLGRFGERTGEIFEKGFANATEDNILEALRQTMTEMFFVAALLMVAAAVLSLGLGSGRLWPRGGSGGEPATSPATGEP